jgi:exopolysaccharide production protein ExoZ
MTAQQSPGDARRASQDTGMLYSIHALRFVAAAAVVVHHALTAFYPPLTSILVAASGVDVFFIISGIVIGLSDHDDRALGFAVKRFIRVIPMYWIATFVYCMFRYNQYGEIPKTSTLLHSIFLIPIYGIDWAPIYYPAWTLSFEMFFYVVYAVMLKFVGTRVNLATALVMAFLASVNIPVPFMPGTTFMTVMCVEFVGGLLIAELLVRGARIDIGLGLLSLGLGILGFAMNPYAAASRVLGWGVPALLVTVGVLSLERWQPFRSRLAVLGGSASYAIYLFQIPAMELTQVIGARWSVNLAAQYPVTGALLRISAAIGVGIVVHLLVEKPMTRALRRLFRPMTSRSTTEPVLTLAR